MVSLLLYGKRIVGRQFYLRKISFLSLYLFGILSALARMNEGVNSGKDVSEDVILVSAFMEEAKRFQKQQGFFTLRKKKHLHKKIFNQYLMKS